MFNKCKKFLNDGINRITEEVEDFKYFADEYRKHRKHAKIVRLDRKLNDLIDDVTAPDIDEAIQMDEYFCAPSDCGTCDKCVDCTECGCCLANDCCGNCEKCECYKDETCTCKEDEIKRFYGDLKKKTDEFAVILKNVTEKIKKDVNDVKGAS